MRENLILQKTYSFALKIIRVYILLKDDKEYLLSKQLLRSATSIGAKAEEGSAAQTRKDFIAKFSIALKEAKETHYWLRLLRDSNILEKATADVLMIECEEIQKIITSILKTSRKNS